MTSELDVRGRSAGDRARSRAYVVDFLPGMAGYGVVLTAVVLRGHLDGHSSGRYLWAVLPVLPALWVVRAVWRHIGRIDDYQRLLLLRGLGGGFAVAMIAAVTMGFLGIAGLPDSPPITGWVVYGAGMMGWAVSTAVGGAVVQRR